MKPQTATAYVIKVGNIGYFKHDKQSKLQSVVFSTKSCTHFECKTTANEILLQFSFNSAIRSRGIKLDVLALDQTK